MANDGMYGIETSGVEAAKEALETAKQHLIDWLEDANNAAGQVSEGWDANASQQFAESYSGLDSDMQTMTVAVQAFKDWADETLESYALLDAKQTSSMSEI